MMNILIKMAIIFMIAELLASSLNACYVSISAPVLELGVLGSKLSPKTVKHVLSLKRDYDKYGAMKINQMIASISIILLNTVVTSSSLNVLSG